MEIKRPVKLTKNEHLFYLCFSFNDKADEIIAKELEEYRRQRLNYDDFKRLLIKTDIEEYSVIFYNYLLKSTSNILDKYETENIFIKTYEYALMYAMKNTGNFLTHSDIELLLETAIYLNKHKDETISISLKNNKGISDNLKTTNDYMINLIYEAILNELKRIEINKTYLTYEESEEEIRNLKDKTWIRNYIDTTFIEETDEYDFIIFTWDSCDEIEAFIDDEMIETYRYEHFKDIEITNELLTSKLKEYKEQSKKTAGAKPKNDNLAKFIIRLSYLFRIKSFFMQNKYSEIHKMPLSNKECTLIFDILNFLQIAPEIDPNTTTLPRNIIRSYINNYRKRESKINDGFYLIEERINNLKNNKVAPF